MRDDSSEPDAGDARDAADVPNVPRARLLVIEDEAAILRGLCDVLRYRGYEVHAATDGATGLQLGLTQRWDLIVLDIMLPELNGFIVCERLREAGCDMPVLMLTAKGDEDDIVRGFESGANDYVTKPFGIRELTARLDALLRRLGHGGDADFRIGPLDVVPARSEARCGQEVYTLTAREVRILQVLFREAGRIVSRRTLLRDGWDMNNSGRLETRTVDMHIAKLRKKLGPHGELIATVRGQGYRLCV